MKRKFKLFNSFDNRELNASKEIIKRGLLSGFVADKSNAFYGGKYVNRLEKSFCKYFNSKYAISVNSWTSGLVCAVGSLNIKPGDEIIVSPWTMSATATAILCWGAIPVFSEIDERTYCLDFRKLENKITKKTRAIMVTDIFGQSANYKEIMKVAKKNNLKVISDTAQAIGSKSNNKYSGTISDIGGFSLNRHKHIQTGEGGVILTNNKYLATNMFKIRNHGEVINKDKKFRNLIGFNFRMNEIEAAIGLEQLKKLKNILKDKTSKAEYLTKLLNQIPGLITPYIDKGNTHVYYCYPIKINKKIIKVKKNKIFKALKSEGIPIEENYVNLMDYYIYSNSKIRSIFPWSLNKKTYYSKKSKVYSHTKSIISNFFNISFCEYDFSKEDIKNIYSAFLKVWRNFNLIK